MPASCFRICVRCTGKPERNAQGQKPYTKLRGARPNARVAPRIPDSVHVDELAEDLSNTVYCIVSTPLAASLVVRTPPTFELIVV
jgi:hypothetical protein